MDLSEFDIDFLSQKLSDNPHSPLFARLADLYLSKDQSSEALKLCEAGVQTFSSYATGYVVLGRCYLALNENSKARLAFAQALHLAPFNQLARKFLDEIPPASDEPSLTTESESVEVLLPAVETQLSLESPVAEVPVQEETFPTQNMEEPSQSAENFSAASAPEDVMQESAEQKEPNLVETPPIETAQLPGVDEYVQQHSESTGVEKLMSLDEYLGQASTPATPEAAGLDSLASQLENAERIVPQEAEPSASPEETAPLDSIVITPTLAEIYASQGEYGAAIQAYEILIFSKPEERERFEKRITELQAKLNEGG
ncbi:MAG: hypothetical protein WBW71_00815 [Bacteroidota bacterium]